jgi:inosose dehydratase
LAELGCYFLVARVGGTGYKRLMTTYQTRREFLRHTTAAAILGGTLPLLGPVSGRGEEPWPGMLVGSQLYGWGQYYQRDGKDLTAHLDEVFAALRDCGYDYAEANMDVGTPENNLKLAERMKARGLKPVCLYTGARLHEEGKAEANAERIVRAARSCQEAGFRVINCNADPLGREKTDAELRVQAAALDTMGAGLKALGLKLGIHHHTPEMVNKAREFHYVFRHTKADAVGFCFDVHWVYRGGLDPMEALKEYHERVVSWHLRQSRNGIWWEDLSDGDIDYAAVAKFARSHRVAPIFSIEMALEGGTKITRSVIENHRRSRDYIRQVFGA